MRVTSFSCEPVGRHRARAGLRRPRNLMRNGRSPGGVVLVVRTVVAVALVAVLGASCAEPSRSSLPAPCSLLRAREVGAHLDAHVTEVRRVPSMLDPTHKTMCSYDTSGPVGEVTVSVTRSSTEEVERRVAEQSDYERRVDGSGDITFVWPGSGAGALSDGVLVELGVQYYRRGADDDLMPLLDLALDRLRAAAFAAHG